MVIIFHLYVFRLDRTADRPIFELMSIASNYTKNGVFGAVFPYSCKSILHILSGIGVAPILPGHLIAESG